MDKSKIKTKVLLFLIENLAFILLWFIYLTCKVNYTNTKLPKGPCVVVFWHGRLAMMSFAYRKWWTFANKEGKVIISDHKDGEIITRIIKKFKIKAIRGSSSKGGAIVLKQAFQNIQNGVDIIITPDGPRGPRHSIANGAVVLAQKKDLNIYALNYEASKFWQFRSWDAMVLPKPFSTINYSLSEPFSVKDMDIKDAKSKILNILIKQAEADNKPFLKS